MEINPISQCRICLESANAMMNLFEDSKTHKLELCCGVEILDIPPLPSKICKNCSDILNVAYGFRVLCQRSQEYLNDRQNILDIDEYKLNPCQERVSPVSPKLELKIEFAQKEANKNVEYNASYESTPVGQNAENEKRELHTDEEDYQPDIKFFPPRPPTRQPKSPITLMCNICGNLFRNKATFSYHMKLHRNDKKYECEICSKRFMQTCELRAHIRVHTGEKPYGCSHCDRKFRDRSGVTRHERTHTNERPFGCTICGANFSYSATLKKHERVHTGEKPFSCIICDKGFSEAHQIKAHFGTLRHAEMTKEKSKIDFQV